MQKLVKAMANGNGVPGLAGMPGIGGIPGGKGLGGLGGLLGGRKQLAALRALGGDAGDDGDGLAGLLSGSGRLPSLDAVATGGRSASQGGARVQRGAKGKNKKKKGGRVTPPKDR